MSVLLLSFGPNGTSTSHKIFFWGEGGGGGGGRRGVGMGLLWVENTLGLLMLQLINPFNKL